jgi:alpha-beta hydrolase superfamily lysophospholipase
MGGGGPYGNALLTEANPRKLFFTAIHALRMGLSLGDQMVLVGMSTGATLLTWLASLKFVRNNQHVASKVLISPAYALGHPLYPVLKYAFATMRIWAPQSLRQWMLLGRYPWKGEIITIPIARTPSIYNA